MRQKIANGTMVDFLTPAEMTDGINTILAKLGQNAKFSRVVAGAQANAAGAFKVQLGPNDSFMWSVMAVAVDIGAAGSYGVFVNNDNAISRIISAGAPATVPTFFSKAQVILKGNDVLIFEQGTVALTAGQQVTVQVSVVEVPFGHEAQLLL